MEMLGENQMKKDLKLPNVDIPDFMLNFLMYLKGKGRTQGTYVRYGYYLEDFVTWLNTKGQCDFEINAWKQLKEEDYRSYYQYLRTTHGYTLESLKRVSSVLMQLYLYLASEGQKGKAPPCLHKQFVELIEEEYTPREFVLEDDFETLLKVLRSKEGLTKHQLKGRDKLINRNVAIVTLFFKYGLTLQEVVNIKMTDLQFGVDKTITIKGKRNQIRKIEIEPEDKSLILKYLEDVPKPVRPKWYRTHHPLFAAFDYQRLTYRWVYVNEERIDNGHPKALSTLAIQKMVLQEVKRAGLEKKKISAQTMRNAAILRFMEKGESDEEVMKYFGLKSAITLRNYKKYLNDEKMVEK